MAFTVKDVPIWFWFELSRNGNQYIKISKGRTGNHSLCVRKGESLAWNMSNQSHVRLIPSQGKPRLRYCHG